MTVPNHIHITGAAGSGTTTLGDALSRRHGYRHFDSDDYFWIHTQPPYEKQREKAERIRMLLHDLKSCDKWILSGSVSGWGETVAHLFDLVIYLWIPTELRLERLEKRELKEFGDDILKPGTNANQKYQTFFEWASKYDSAGVEMRSRVKHEQWMESLDCQIVRLERDLSTEQRLQELEPMFAGS